MALAFVEHSRWTSKWAYILKYMYIFLLHEFLWVMLSAAASIGYTWMGSGHKIAKLTFQIAVTCNGGYHKALKTCRHLAERVSKMWTIGITTSEHQWPSGCQNELKHIAITGQLNHLPSLRCSSSWFKASLSPKLSSGLLYTWVLPCHIKTLPCT